MLKRNFLIAMFGFLSLMLVAVASSQREHQEETTAVAAAAPTTIASEINPMPEIRPVPTTTTTTTTTLPPPPPTTIKKSGQVRGAARSAPSPSETHTAPSESYASMEPCGGDLPPCWVKKRESGGNYNAYNPKGCGGSGCYGAWQFSGEWAGKLGLPKDLSTATPEQQDNAARQLWNGGQGCRNWNAC